MKFLRWAVGTVLLITVPGCQSSKVDEPSTGHSAAQQSASNGDDCAGPRTIEAFGDSLTYGATKTNGQWSRASPTWLQTMATDLGGWCTVNEGVPSQGSAEIAVRQGGLRPKVTLSGNQIPASPEPVAATEVSPTDGWTLFVGSGVMDLRGTLAGVAGNLRRDVNADAWSFLPDSRPDSPVTVSSGTEFIGARRDRDPQALQIIWAGTNNAAQPDAIKRDIASMVSSMPRSQRYLIIGTIPTVSAALAEAYGSRFVDLRSWLSTNGLTRSGVVAPTHGDLLAAAAGRVPPSLTVDAGGHFTQDAYNAIGHYLATVVTAQDWN